MGCHPSHQEQNSSIVQLRKQKRTRIGSVQALRIDATSFVSPGIGCLLDHYILEETLFTGVYGLVRKAVHKTTQLTRAIKSFKKSIIFQGDMNINKFFHEIEVLKQTDHPNIVKVFEFYEDAKYYHLVTEYIGGGELLDYILKNNSLSECTAAHFIRQLLSAVAYCHSKKIVHRDLKPENLLMDSQESDAILKVIDFGTSTILDSANIKPQKFGSVQYTAPEVFDKNYNEKCDIWSCGIILYILLSGKPPFMSKNRKDLIQKVKKFHLTFSDQVWAYISDNAKDLITKMLDFNPELRISASEAVQSEWILSNTNINPNNICNASLLINLRCFRSNRKMQCAVLAFISSQLQAKNETKELIEIFRTIDINGDGKISKDELLEAYSNKLGRKNAIEVVDKIMKQADTNNSGFIDFSEFLLASNKLEDLLNNDYLVAAFRAFDRDGNGKINSSELREVLGSNLNVDDNVWQEMINEVDENCDGMIDIEEFKIMMKKLIDE